MIDTSLQYLGLFAQTFIFHMIDAIHFLLYGGNPRGTIIFTYYAIVVIAYYIVLVKARNIFFWTCVIALILPVPAFLVLLSWQYRATIIKVLFDHNVSIDHFFES